MGEDGFPIRHPPSLQLDDSQATDTENTLGRRRQQDITPHRGPRADQDSQHLDLDTSSCHEPQHSPGSLGATTVGAIHRAATAGTCHCPQGAPWRALQPHSNSWERTLHSHSQLRAGIPGHSGRRQQAHHR